MKELLRRLIHEVELRFFWKPIAFDGGVTNIEGRVGKHLERELVRVHEARRGGPQLCARVVGNLAQCCSEERECVLIKIPNGVVSPGGDLMRLSTELETPDNPDNKVLRYWQLPEFTIEADREVHFNLDGEPTTEHKLHFSVLPRHLKVAF